MNLYTLGQLSACRDEMCQQIAELQQCVAELKEAGSPTYSLEKTFRTCCVGISGATVNQAGQIVERCGDTDFNIQRTATGFYDFTPPAGALFAHVEAIESPASRDSIEMHMGTSFTGGTAWIGEGDNGAGANTPRDRPFSVIWYGDKELLVDVTLVGGGDGGTGNEGPDLGEPANGALVSDNFQDGSGNAPFNLQVRNTTNTSTNWQAVVTGPYSTIPGLVPGNYTLQTVENGDGNYTHVFTGTAPLGPFQNITITGGLPVPAGSGGTGSVGLYIP